MGKPRAADSVEFITRFSFTGYEINTEIDPEKVEAYNEDNPLFKLYTQPEAFVESNDKEIVEIANRVAGDETNPYKMARKFYDYVVDTARYKLLGEGLRGAKALVTSGIGECGDYSSLLIALLRAKGIPARPVVGYWAVSGIDQAHVWAEFYLEEVGWIPVDPTVGQDRQRDYYFGNMDNQRVILNKGFNIRLIPSAPDDYVAPFLQVPSWWYWGSSGDENSVNLDHTAWRVKKIRD
jgi:transglutaminase-like putative cysteine protease